MTRPFYATAGLALAILVATAVAPAAAAEWWNPFKQTPRDESPVETMTPPAAVGSENAPVQPAAPGGGPIPLGGQVQTSTTGPAPLGTPAADPANDLGALAATGDPITRIDRLEAMVRQLNGAVEKLVFENTKLREDLKKLQDDSDYRFQALEGGQRPPQQRSDSEPLAGRRDFGAADLNTPAGTEGTSAVVAPAPAPATSTATASLDPIASAVEGAQLGAPPAPLGTLTLDGSSPAGGQVVGATVAEAAPAAGVAPINLSSLNPENPPASTSNPQESAAPDPNAPAAAVSPTPRTNVAAIPPSQLTGTPTEVYNRAYQSVLDGDYDTAEQGFRAFLVAFPTDKRAPDAQYWIGDSLYQRGLYREAGREFNTGFRAYPKSPKAADSLLRLGMSLNALGQREAACSVYGELTKRYPNAPFALQQKVKTEQTSASC